MARRASHLKAVRDDEQNVISGTWAAYPKKRTDVADLVFGVADKESEGHSLHVARYILEGDSLSELKSTWSWEKGASPPGKIAAQPTGDGVVISFENSCKLFTKVLPEGKITREGELKLEPGERVLEGLENVGPQKFIVFSNDGTHLASAGEDGYIRVFKWPNMEVVMDLPKTMKSIRDFDISLDNGFVSAIGGNKGACCVWDLNDSELLAEIEPEKDERFGFARFSRNYKKAFLFISIAKDKRGRIGVWDMTTWNRIGSKKFMSEPITALATTHHGRKLAMGTGSGDVFIIEAEKMVLKQTIRNAHSESVTWLEFSPNDKAILSIASNSSSRVSAVNITGEWKEWQLNALLLLMILASAGLFYLLYRFGEGFFNPDGSQFRTRDFPLQGDFSSYEAHLNDDSLSHGSHQEL